MSTDDPKPRKGRFLPVAPPREDGTMVGVLLEKDGFTPTGFKPIKEGEPIMGTYAELNRRKGEIAFDTEIHEGIGGVETFDDSQKRSWGSTGKYRDGWDRIWGSKEDDEAEA